MRRDRILPEPDSMTACYCFSWRRRSSPLTPVALPALRFQHLRDRSFTWCGRLELHF
ncbi:hypothetical protein [Calothrix sp. NIES-2098]|uniref:hypothetical protein n=1 Tax=Calothrix sp. NIES-2098 TaxID=1954171 RepID=UPI0030DB5ED4